MTQFCERSEPDLSLSYFSQFSHQYSLPDKVWLVLEYQIYPEIFLQPTDKPQQVRGRLIKVLIKLGESSCKPGHILHLYFSSGSRVLIIHSSLSISILCIRMDNGNSWKFEPVKTIRSEEQLCFEENCLQQLPVMESLMIIRTVMICFLIIFHTLIQIYCFCLEFSNGLHIIIEKAFQDL